MHHRGVVDSKYAKQANERTPINTPISILPSRVVTYFDKVAEVGKNAFISFDILLKELEAEQ